MHAEHTPFGLTFLQSPVLSMHTPLVSVNPERHDWQLADGVSQFMAPTHLSSWRIVPNPQEMHLVGSDGLKDKHAE